MTGSGCPGHEFRLARTPNHPDGGRAFQHPVPLALKRNLGWVVCACVSHQVDKNLIKQGWHLHGIQAGGLPDGDDEAPRPGGRCGERRAGVLVHGVVAAARVVGVGLVLALRADRAPGDDGGGAQRDLVLDAERARSGPEVASSAKPRGVNGGSGCQGGGVCSPDCVLCRRAEREVLREG